MCSKAPFFHVAAQRLRNETIGDKTMSDKHEIKKWDPFRELEKLQDRMRSLFVKTGTGNGNGAFSLLSDSEFSDWSPAVDIGEDDEEYTIIADLPDVGKDQVKVTLDDGCLTIRGEREKKEEEKKKRFHRVERSYGKYVRSFRIPEEVDEEQIDAQFDKGVLTVHLPKGQEAGREEKEIAIH